MINTYNTAEGLAFDIQKDEDARRDERWRAEAVTPAPDLYWTDLKTGRQHPCMNSTGIVAWFPTRKEARRWAEGVPASWLPKK